VSHIRKATGKKYENSSQYSMKPPASPSRASHSQASFSLDIQRQTPIPGRPFRLVHEPVGLADQCLWTTPIERICSETEAGRDNRSNPSADQNAVPLQGPTQSLYNDKSLLRVGLR
jgi:hypothetical protein